MKNLAALPLVGLGLFLLAGCGGPCDGTSVRRGEETICVPRNQSTNYGQGTQYSPTMPTGTLPDLSAPSRRTTPTLPEPTLPSTRTKPTSPSVPDTAEQPDPFDSPFFKRDPFNDPFFKRTP